MARPTVQGIYVSWTFMKNLIDSNDLMVHYTETSKKYYIQVYNGSTLYKTTLIKDGVVVGGSDWDEQQNTSDRTDFENNYKSNANGLEKTPIRIEADTEINANIQSQTLANTLRYDKFISNQSISTSSLTEVYSYTGSGSFYGAYIELTYGEMELTITIDGVKIMDTMTLADLPSGGPGESGGSLGSSCFIKKQTDTQINIEPPMAIKFESSVKIELKSIKNNKKLSFGYIVLTKES